MLAAVVASAGLAAPIGAAARDFTIASWGGAYQDGLREIFFTPFGKAEGVTFLEDTYLGGWAQFEAMKSTGVYNWDVVQVETTELFKGCEDGTFLKLDWNKIAQRGDLVKGAASTCGLGAVIAGHVLAFNNDKISEKPTGLADFWDAAKWPGKRGMRKGPKYNLELALLADGVEPTNVYEVLSDPAGVDRAFAKLDQIKPTLQFWESGAQPIQWLTSGDVVMAIAYNGRVDGAVKNGQPIGAVWNRFTYDMDQWVVLANSEHQDAGYKFLNFYIDPKREAALAERVGYGVPNQKATDFIPADGQANLPLGDKMAGGLFAGSDEAMAFWLDHDEELTERWNAWSSAN
ncbi:ABC transporter substrate-binding protein [Aminobacter aminovorans]|nr:ABC transporter substrate-binding protein [Aminobacter aminovorans]